jgi:hypothetical protein
VTTTTTGPVAAGGAQVVAPQTSVAEAPKSQGADGEAPKSRAPEAPASDGSSTVTVPVTTTTFVLAPPKPGRGGE